MTRLSRRDRCDTRRAASLLACAVVAAVAAGCLPRVQRDQPVDVTHVYTCPGDFRFSVRQFGEVATVRQSMETLALPRVRSASGVRYAAEGAEFFTRGQVATLTIGSARHTGCTGQLAPTPHDVARLLDVDYRAVGQEPLWSLEIDETRYMRFAIEGSSAMYMPVPAPAGDAARRVYRVVSEAQNLEVVIEATPCRDPSSPDPFPHTVIVTHNGIPYPGCGGPLAAAR